MNYYEVNPGGNITAIVRGSYKLKDRLAIAKKILTQNQKVEQVGFWVEARQVLARPRLEMAGGEFCGNATRCLAYLFAQQTGRKFFSIQSSGVTRPVKCQVTKGNTIQITLPRNLFSLNFQPNKIEPAYNLVRLSGISYLVTTSSVNYGDIIPLLKKFRLLKEKAASVISYQIRNKTVIIKPFVWVNLTKTLYEETACASGSMAVALILGAGNNQISWISVKQPSGYILKVKQNKEIISLVGPIVRVKIRQIR